MLILPYSFIKIARNSLSNFSTPPSVSVGIFIGDVVDGSATQVLTAQASTDQALKGNLLQSPPSRIVYVCLERLINDG